MKRISLLFTVLILFCNWMVAQNEKISFNEIEHNFGDVNEKGGNATCEFVVTNHSQAPIVISNVTASCGCTRPVWTREPIESGKTGKITVSYDPLGRIGAFTKPVTVYIDQDAPVYLRIKGNVLRDEDIKKNMTPEQAYPVAIGSFLLKTKELNFGKVNMKESKTVRLEAFNNSDKPVTQKALKLPKNMTVNFIPAVVPPKTAAVIDVKLDTQNPGIYGNISGDILLQFNKVQGAFPYKATVQEDFSKWSDMKKANAGKLNVTVSMINFGSFQSGNTRTVKMANSGKSALTVYSIQSSDPLVTVSKNQFTINPSEIVEIKVSVDSRKVRGKLSAVLTVFTDDPAMSAYTISVSADGNNS